MKNRNEWPSLTPEEIDEEVEIRFDLMKQMHGWLYPSILQDEIIDLRELKKDKQEAFLQEQEAIKNFDDAKPE